MSKSNGYIYVASKNKIYYEFALLAIESLKTFHPASNVTLFTHESWVDDRALALVDNIITDIPIHTRAKMWCMARTPYDTTFYTDVDSQVISRNIKHAFRDLGESDMFFTNSFHYTTANYQWSWIDKQQTIKVPYHGAVCCYKKTDLTLDFMQTWFDEYVKQRNSKTWDYERFAHQAWQQFDMFTLWRMTSGEYKEFDRFNNLDIKLGPKHYCATVQDRREEYKGKIKPSNIQIDSSFYLNTYYATIMQKGIDDERNLPKRPKIRENSIAFD